MVRVNLFGSVGLKYSLIIHALIILALLVHVSKYQELRIPERIISIEVGLTKSGPITNLQNKVAFKPQEPKIKSLPKELAQLESSNKIVEKVVAPVKEKDKPTETNLRIQEKDSKEVDKILSQLENQPSSFQANKNETKSHMMSDKPYDKNNPITLAYHDNIRMQIERKLSTPVAVDSKPGELVVRVKLDLKINGEVGKITVLNSSTYPASYADAFSALKDSLIRAVHMANPLQGLPTESYEGKQGWSEIEMAFDAYHLKNNS
jgi:hypothetical protein